MSRSNRKKFYYNTLPQSALKAGANRSDVPHDKHECLASVVHCFAEQSGGQERGSEAERGADGASEPGQREDRQAATRVGCLPEEHQGHAGQDERQERQDRPAGQRLQTNSPINSILN